MFLIFLKKMLKGHCQWLLDLLVAEDNEADNVANDAQTASDDGDQTPDDQGDVIIGSVLLPGAAGRLYQLWTNGKSVFIVSTNEKTVLIVWTNRKTVLIVSTN